MIEDTNDSNLMAPRGVVRSLHEDMGGTAMTELVIVLPIFVFMFSAILQLYKAEELVVQGRGSSFAIALQDFNSIQKAVNPIDDNISPSIAFATSGAWHLSTSGGATTRDFIADGVYDTLPFTPVIGGGTLSEQYSRMVIPGVNSAQDVAGDVELEPEFLYRDIGTLVSNAPVEADGVGTAAGAAYAPDLLGDSASFGASFSGGPMSFVNGAISTIGARPAIAAGIRYGIAKGKFDQESEPFLGRTLRVQSASHIIAPPRPTSKWLGRGIIHAYLASSQWENYNKTIPKFAMSPDLSNPTPEADTANRCKDFVDGLNTSGSMSRDEARDLQNSINNNPDCQSARSGSGGFISGLKNLFENGMELFEGAESMAPRPPESTWQIPN